MHLLLLDWSFEIFHCLLILFVLLGWISRRTRRAHLMVTTLTLLSWTLLGLRYGFGYCPCTDWHWEVKARLGARGLPPSFVKYLADSLSGLDWDAGLVDMAVAAAGVLSFSLSVWLNCRDLELLGGGRRVRPTR